jgi:hypothetical protein
MPQTAFQVKNLDLGVVKVNSTIQATLKYSSTASVTIENVVF